MQVKFEPSGDGAKDVRARATNGSGNTPVSASATIGGCHRARPRRRSARRRNRPGRRAPRRPRRCSGAPDAPRQARNAAKSPRRRARRAARRPSRREAGAVGGAGSGQGRPRRTGAAGAGETSRGSSADIGSISMRAAGTKLEQKTAPSSLSARGLGLGRVERGGPPPAPARGGIGGDRLGVEPAQADLDRAFRRSAKASRSRPGGIGGRYSITATPGRRGKPRRLQKRPVLRATGRQGARCRRRARRRRICSAAARRAAGGCPRDR